MIKEFVHGLECRGTLNLALSCWRGFDKDLDVLFNCSIEKNFSSVARSSSLPFSIKPLETRPTEESDSGCKIQLMLRPSCSHLWKVLALRRSSTKACARGTKTVGQCSFKDTNFSATRER